MGRTIITGAAVHRHGRRWDETDAELLIEDGRVVAYGGDGELSSAASGDDTVLRLPGGRVIPAFFDAHIHLDQGGRYLNCLQLRNHKTRSDVLDAIASAAGPGDGWLVGIGLSEHAWPSLEELDRVSPHRPLLIHSRDYHSVLVNSAAIELVGLTGDIPLPSGGWQELDARGNPAGVLRENAARWVEQKLPQETPEQIRAHLRRAINHLLELGVTGVSDAGERRSFTYGLAPIERDEGLPLHVESWLRCEQLDERGFVEARRTRGRLRRTRIKLFIDGALGSRTAWMHEPYADRDGWRAHALIEQDDMRRFLDRGVERGWSFAVHAIGDAGVAAVARALAGTPAPAGPHRIEHIQHIDPETLALLRGSNLIHSVQPLHRLADVAMLRARLGVDRAELSYPLKSLDVGERLALGSDWPVVDCDPRQTMRAALLPRGEGEGMPGEELGVEEALLAHTENAASAAGFAVLGRTEPGAPADLAWLETDPGGDAELWPETRIGAVWKHGVRIEREHDLV
ncbi:MAG: N-substituted formamide deformylase [Calditrichaeota bacterium]|nr:N-substituted formamide deformylase [Calditrichota bacterium]